MRGAEMIDLDVKKLKAYMDSEGINQTDLSTRSGVSRAQVIRVLSTNKSKVRESTLAKLASAVGLEPLALTVGGVEQLYRAWIHEQFGCVDFRGIGLPQFQKQ